MTFMEFNVVRRHLLENSDGLFLAAVFLLEADEKLDAEQNKELRERVERQR